MSKPTTNFFGFQLNQQNGTIEPVRMPGGGIPAVAYAQAVLLPDNDHVLMFGGNNDEMLDNNSTLLVQEYQFTTGVWQVLNVTAPSNATNGTVPQNRYKHTATLSPNGKIYIYGGQIPGTTTNYFFDFWEYDPSTGRFTEIPIDHDTSGTTQVTAVTLPDWRIIFMMGSSQEVGVNRVWQHAWIFDVKNRIGYRQEISNETVDSFPLARYGCNAMLGPDNTTIYYFGGRQQYPNGTERTNSQTRLYTFNELNILDTKTWMWLSPSIVRGEMARPRYDAAGGLLYGKYWMILGGISEFAWTNDVNVLEIPDAKSTNSNFVEDPGTFTWLYNITDPTLGTSKDDESKELGGGAIAGIVLGSLAAAVLLLMLAWTLRHRKREPLAPLTAITNSMISMIWDRRAGEPLWAAILHSVSKLLLSGLFIAYCIYSIIRIIKSSETTMVMSKPVARVRVPDIRFCFDNYDQSDALNVQSDTVSRPDARVKWKDYLTILDMRHHAPSYPNSIYGDIRCWLFAAPPDFQLEYQAIDQSSNGTKLRFLVGGGMQRLGFDTSHSRVHISVYHPDHNPNKVVYNISNQPNLSDMDIQEWLRRDRNDQETENTYTTEINAYSSISYQLKNHRYLQNIPWNAVGFAQSRNNTPMIETNFRTTIQDDAMMVRNTLDVYPMSFMEIEEEDQRTDTLMSSFGLVGGILSLFTFMLTRMYGSRPSSMHGWIMKLPFNKPSRSIERNLLQSFGSLGQPIPFVNPVDHHLLNDQQIQEHNLVATSHDNLESYSVSDLHAKMENAERIHQQEISDLKRRLQLMELIFKSYYIDDEVFNRLYDAHCGEEASESNNDNATSLTDNGGMLTRLFRRRRYHPQNMHDEEQSPGRSNASLLNLPEKQ
ncbi:hypothetical protein K492DRAFT_203691 [Lichtheimia hyalospora FSU 10163]|nr:hypothetical protein K492DRAFT_203691 [Lichtheimia hyalospora FSU 10163]